MSSSSVELDDSRLYGLEASLETSALAFHLCNSRVAAATANPAPTDVSFTDDFFIVDAQ